MGIFDEEINKLRKQMLEGAQRPINRLDQLIDSEDEKIALEASKHYLKLLQLEQETIVHSGQVEFKPLILSDE